MFENYKVIAVTPAGRKKYLEILLPYILQNRGVIDEYHLWVNTNNQSDIQYMEELSNQFTDFIKLVKLNVEASGNSTIRYFFRNCIEKNTIYIRIDDDICFIKDDAIVEMLNFRIKHPEYFIIYANILNNSICTYINQRNGNLGFFKENLTYNCFCNQGWKSGELASFIHYKFFSDLKENLLDKYKYHCWILNDFERVSVNFITWFGEEFADFNGIVSGIDEEEWLSVEKPKSINKRNAICGTAIVSHFSYYTQREYLESQTEHLDKYKKISLDILSILKSNNHTDTKQVNELEDVFIDISKNSEIPYFIDKINTNSKSFTKVKSIASGENRPFWSVMIPTYNCADYLVETLKSVLAQDPGSELMQIEVVDDCSTKDDPEAIVREIGKGRVSFYRQPQNVGVTANFNTCIQRSKGKWVHILHGDDTVLPGFYSKLQQGIENEHSLGAAFTRSIIMDENSNWKILSSLEKNSSGILSNFLSHLVVSNRILTPCIVVKRSVYEQIGGFNEELSHAADWEMWKRITANYSIWYEPQLLACYREHSASDTSKLMRSGENILDIRKSIDITESYLPAEIAEELSKRSRGFYGMYAISTAQKMLQQDDIEAAINQIKASLLCSDSYQTLASVAGLFRQVDVLHKILASLILSNSTEQILSPLVTTPQTVTETDLEFDFKDINLITFPDWHQPENLLYQDLATLIKNIFYHPARENIMLFVDTTEISEEDANLVFFNVLFNLMQEEDLDGIEEMGVSIIGTLTQKQWQALLPFIDRRIALNTDNKTAIYRVSAENIPVCHVENIFMPSVKL